MKTALLSLFGLAILLTFPACTQFDKLLGKDDDNASNSAPAPAPAPDPGVVERFDLYKDGGGAANTDPLSEKKAVAPMTLLNIPTGGGEGNEFFRLHTENNSSFHITFDKDLTGRTVDLSGRSNIVFMIRFYRRVVLTTDEIFLFVEDGNGVVGEIALQSASGLNIATKDVWQTVSIPVAALGGLDVTKIKRPFGLRIGTKGDGDSVDDDPSVVNHLDIDFDDVRWQP